jgi:predicted cupin superfamily sugar epimerase
MKISFVIPNNPIMNIDFLVSELNLVPHPEGGFYKEVYRSKGILPQVSLGNHFDGDRNFCTSIYFLLTGTNFSSFHRLKQDEIWHFYGGSPLLVHVISPDGVYCENKVGMNFKHGEVPQLVEPAGSWFGSEVSSQNPADFSFVGCTVAPGFDFNDFEMPPRQELINLFPQHSTIINRLTRI